MKTAKQIEDELKRPFPEDDIDWMPSPKEKMEKGTFKALAYVDARAIQDRLDEVVGIDNWQANYQQWNGGVLCTLTLKINNTYVSKEDGSEPSDWEPFKGAISGALKRAASQWGIGRYLHNLKHEKNLKARVIEGYNPDANYSMVDGKKVNWLPPKLPAWALPSPEETDKMIEDATKKNAARLQESLNAGKKEANREDPGAAKKEPPKVGKAPPPKGRKDYNTLYDLIQKAETIEQLIEIWMTNQTHILALDEYHRNLLEKIKNARKIVFGYVDPKDSKVTGARPVATP